MNLNALLDRRSIIKACGCGAAAAAAGGVGMRALAASPADVIDVHYHVTTERMRKVADAATSTRLVSDLPQWSPSSAIAEMDRDGVAISVISMPVVSTTVPGGAKGHADFARGANEDAAAIVRQRPDRFRFFAFLPLPFIEETLAEIAYAFDTLKADGVYMCTSYGDKWLGDPTFAPVMAELNRRGAIVFTHPMGATCCAVNLVAKVPPTIVEYGTDTTRSIASLIFSGTAQRFPDIKFIFSHAGGSAPFLFERFDVQAQTDRKTFPDGARAALSHFFYDTAQAANPYALGTLARLVPASQILFGSDLPWRKQGLQLAAIEKLALGTNVTAAIRHGNARRLLPSLAGVARG